jgi:hypothetical protein
VSAVLRGDVVEPLDEADDDGGKSVPDVVVSSR